MGDDAIEVLVQMFLKEREQKESCKHWKINKVISEGE